MRRYMKVDKETMEKLATPTIIIAGLTTRNRRFNEITEATRRALPSFYLHGRLVELGIARCRGNTVSLSRVATCLATAELQRGSGRGGSGE